MKNKAIKLPKVQMSKILVDEFMKVRKDELNLPEGKSYPYYVVETVPSSTAIIALSSDNKVLITEEYRHAVQTIVYGCPGGNLEVNEDIIAGAKRELLEETGCVAASFEIIGESFPLPGIYQHKTYFVLAKGAKWIQNPALDETEAIISSFMDVSEIKRITKESKKVDGILCQALYFLSLCNYGF